MISVPINSFAATYYVDAASGGDSNNGSQSSPWATIHFAADTASPGDEIRVAKGTYFEHVRIIKDVKIYGGYETSGWTRDINSNITIIDGRGVTNYDHYWTGSNATVSFSSDSVSRAALLDSFTIYGPSVLVPPTTEDEAGSSVWVGNDSAPTIANCIIYGPEHGQKIFTIRPTGGSNPLFKFCKIYGGRGTDLSQSKLEIICPWASYPEFEDCEVYGGSDAHGSSRTVLLSGNSHVKFRRTTFYASEISQAPDTSYFRVLTVLANNSYTDNYAELYDCVIYGANAGSASSTIVKTQYADGVWDYSKTVFSNCDLILGTTDDPDEKNFYGVDLATIIPAAGGTYSNMRLWNSVEEYNQGSSDDSPPTAPQGLDATAISDTQISLTWAASSDPDSGIASYNVYRDGNKVATSSKMSYIDNGLTENTSYSYELSAVNGAGMESTKSAPISATSLADTTPPNITSVSLTEGVSTQVTVVFSEEVEQSSAANVSNYSIDNDISVSGAALGADLKTVTLTTSLHSEGPTYKLTVNNISDRSNNNNVIESNTTVSYTFVAQLVISNLSAASGLNYEFVTDNLIYGELVYIDRSITFKNVPESLQNDSYIKTANDDKESVGNSFITFDVNKDVTVYVVHDERIDPKPSWMESFTATGEILKTSDATFIILEKDYPAGTITLGGNEGDGRTSMYIVAIETQSQGDGSNQSPAPPIGLSIVYP